MNKPRYVIRPLFEEYDSVVIRTTQLAKVEQCAYLYNNQSYEDSPAKEFGRKAHKMLEYFMYNKGHYDLIHERFVEPETDKHHKKLLWEYMDLAKEHIPEALIGEHTMGIDIECWAYLIHLQGTFDAIQLDGAIADYKTSQSKWQPDRHLEEFQPRCYTFLYHTENGIDWDDVSEEDYQMFRFHIFSKHKRDPARLDNREMKVSLLDAKRRVIGAIIKYVTAKYKDEWNPTWNPGCVRCPLKKVCPLQNPI